MIELYKLIHANYDRNASNIINLYKDHNKLNERTRGHMWKTCHERSRLKGALYRIWCGVNRLGDSGVKVV